MKIATEREFFRTVAMFLACRLECVERPHVLAGLGELDARAECRAIVEEWREARDSQHPTNGERSAATERNSEAPSRPAGESRRA